MDSLSHTQPFLDLMGFALNNMPSSDYSNAVGGGIKLKGTKDSGVDKKNEKKKKPKAETIESKETPEEDAEQSVVQKALAEEENDDADAVTNQQDL